jgi:hypothetical protein
VGRLHTLDQAVEVDEAGRENESEVFRNTVSRKPSSVIAAAKPFGHVA